MGQVRRKAHGGEHLFLFAAQVVRVEADRLLHGGQRQQLQQVVLDDVARGAHAVVVARAAADADVLGHGDLHVVHVLGVPQRLEELVGEAQRQQVLDGFLAQVVVDPEHRVGREDRFDDLVQLARGEQVVAERLFDDHAGPAGGSASVASARASPCLESCSQTCSNEFGGMER